ncbi:MULTISPECIES: phosphoribosylanthranilate isomerase [unclassified Streptomyces]|uniref:phosphoribosylanthranilate isomerase n=1 Tax=unclassified Streptomyces TaxID=2593676 RepID=UPI003811E6E4
MSSTPLFVKICGLQTERDVDAAVEAGADAVGFVFADSPRRVDAVTARRLARRVPDHVMTVGVFRKQSVDEVRALAQAGAVDAIQLHGGEGPDYFTALRDDGRTLIRAAGCEEGAGRCGDLGEDLLLIDAPDPGSGTPWNWAAEHFTPPTGRWLLAGGLTPKNVQEAVCVTAAWGVDVSSGVEVHRGIKDPGLITSFLEAARAARPPLEGRQP